MHDIALAQLEKYLAREIADPAELAQVMGVLRITFKTYELDVSRFSEEEIQRMYREKVSSTLNLGVPASALTGQKMLRKGVDIGNQISQNTGVFVPVPIPPPANALLPAPGWRNHLQDQPESHYPRAAKAQSL